MTQEIPCEKEVSLNFTGAIPPCAIPPCVHANSCNQMSTEGLDFGTEGEIFEKVRHDLEIGILLCMHFYRNTHAVKQF